MHKDELWQEYSLFGEALNNGGYDGNLKNPDFGSKTFVGSVCIWFYRKTTNGIEVLFQHRSDFVDSNAGMWDISAAGHMNYGDSITDAAIREVKEEIGVDIVPENLRYVFTLTSFKVKNLLNHHFLCDWTGREDNFVFDDGEVSEVKWIPLSEFEKFIEENAKPAVKENPHMRALAHTWLEKMNGDNKS